MSKRNLTPYRKATLGVKTASIASRNRPITRNEDGSVKSAEEIRAARAARLAAGVGEAKPKATKPAKAPKTPSTKKAAKPVKKAAPKKPVTPQIPAPSTADVAAAAAKVAGEQEQTAAPADATPVAEAPKGNGAAKPETVEGESLAPLEILQLPLKLAIAALTVAPANETRFYLNGVYVHQLEDKQIRVVATDGHRLMVSTIAAEAEIAWARAGIIIPRESLARIVKYVGKDAEVLEIEYGVEHPKVVVREVGGMGTFAFAPVAGQFPDYQKIVDDSAAVFADEREGLTVSSFNTKYLKSASVVAAALGAGGIIPFLSADSSRPSVFAFEGFDEALLYVMPQKPREIALPAQTVRIYGAGAIAATLAKLEEQIAKTRDNAKKAKHEKFRQQFAAKADRLEARADQLRAAVSVKLPAPAPKADEEQASEQAPAAPAKSASRPNLSIVH